MSELQNKILKLCEEIMNSKEAGGRLHIRCNSISGLKEQLTFIRNTKVAAIFAIDKIEDFLKEGL